MMKWAWLILLALSVPAAAQSTQTFGNYVNGLPAASTLGSNDQFYVRQGGTSKQVPFSQLSSGGGSGLAITRAQIPATNTNNASALTLTGYLTFGDLGAGAPYTCSGQTSNSWDAIQDSQGTWCALNVGAIRATPGLGVSPGWFGAPGDDGATTISSGNITANPQWRGTYTAGTSWDTVGLQEAAYASWAGTSTPGNVVWNTANSTQDMNLPYYQPVAPSGAYGVTQRLTWNMQGGVVNFADRQTSIINWVNYTAAPTPPDYALYCDGCSYSLYVNLSVESLGQFSSHSYGSAIEAVAFDWSGNINTLKTQNDTFINLYVATDANGKGMVISPSGSGAQGSEITFINPHFQGSGSDTALKVNGDNALGITVLGGDCQGFVHICYQDAGGHLNVYSADFENEVNTGLCGYPCVSPFMVQYTRYGADVYMTGGNEGDGNSVLNGIRSESSIPFLAYSASGAFYDLGQGFDVTDVISTSNDIQAWTSASTFQEGTVVQGGTDGRVFMLVDGGGTQWADFTSYTGNIVTDSAASYSTNQWVGYTIGLRYESNGFWQFCDITANTATTITIDTSCNPGNGGQAQYQILGNTGGSAPSWNSAAVGSQAEFSASATGAFTQANSNCVNLVGISPSTNDYIFIPNAAFVGDSPQYLFPNGLFAKVTATGSCGSGFGNTTINRSPNYTLSQAPVYTATPISDGSQGLKWIDFEYVEAGPATTMRSVNVPNNGLIELGGEMHQVTSNRTAGWDATFINNNEVSVPGGAGQIQLGMTLDNDAHALCHFGISTAATVDMSSQVQNCAGGTYTPTQNATLNFPAPIPNATQFYNIQINTSGNSSFNITCGTNTKCPAPLPTGTTNGAVEYMLFQADGINWNLVASNPPLTVLAAASTGASTQTFTNSPCTGLTTEKWVPVTIQGQSGTWFMPACQ